MELLVIGLVVLAGLMVVNFLLTFALLGRVKSLQQLAETSAGRDPALPKVGDPVGRFQATTADGALVTDEALRSGVVLVGFFAPGCRPCATVREQLLESPPKLPVMAFVEGDDDAAEARVLGGALSKVAQVTYTAQGDSVLKAFRQAGFPTLIRVENGTVAASGHHLHEVLP